MTLLSLPNPVTHTFYLGKEWLLQPLSSGVHFSPVLPFFAYNQFSFDIQIGL